MACHIQSPGMSKADLLGYTFQIVVDVVADVSVNCAFAKTGICDYREKVVAFVFGVFVEDCLHLFCPFYGELLAGFASAVCDVAVGEIRLAEVCHVDETHAA